MTVAELFIDLKIDSKKAQTALDNIDAKLKSAEEAARGFADKIAGLSLGAAGLATGMIYLASESEEVGNKFNTAFQGAENLAENGIKRLTEEFNLSTVQAKRLLAGTGDLLKGFGSTAEEALDTSLQVQELAADLASYNNLEGGTTRASEIITKALLGERDALTSLGVKISEADMKTELLARGQADLTGQAMLQARAQATLSLITQQTGDAVGDVARSQGTFKYQMIAAKNAGEDLAITLGGKLLPAATRILTKATALIDKFTSMDDSTKNLTLGIVLFTAALYPAAKAVQFAIAVQRTIIAVTQFFILVKNGERLAWLTSKLAVVADTVAKYAAVVATNAMTAAQWLLNAALSANPIALVILGIAALVAAFVYAYKNSETFRNFINMLWDNIKAFGSSAWEIMKMIGDAVYNYVIKPVMAGINAVKGAVGAVKGFFGGGGDVNVGTASSNPSSVVRGGGGGITNNNINSSTAIVVPPGNTSEQNAAVKESARKAVQSEWSRMSRQARTNRGAQE